MFTLEIKIANKTYTFKSNGGYRQAQHWLKTLADKPVNAKVVFESEKTYTLRYNKGNFNLKGV